MTGRLGNYRAPGNDGKVLVVRMVMRLVVWGLGVYGAKTLYDKYAGSAEQAKTAGAAIADRVARASDRVRGHAQDAATDVATHARAATQEIRDTASEVVDLSQQPASATEEQAEKQDV